MPMFLKGMHILLQVLIKNILTESRHEEVLIAVIVVVGCDNSVSVSPTADSRLA